MRITKIDYSRLYVTKQYENERIGVEVELEPNESPMEAVDRARTFVESMHKRGTVHPNDVKRARAVLAAAGEVGF